MKILAHGPEPAVDIREPTVDDRPAAAECQITCWLESYETITPPQVLSAFVTDVPNRIANWRSRISRPGLTTLLACDHNDGGRIVGFATADVEPVLASGHKELYSLYVVKAWQGKGVGKLLMDKVLGGENIPTKVWLYEENMRGRAWYERQGFGKEVMERQLKDGAITIMLVRG